MNNDAYRMILNCKLKGHYNKKVSEYELSRRGINPFSTPGSMDEITGWKSWMKTGFNLYTKLEELGYKEIIINKYNNDIQGFIEVAKQIVVTICSRPPGGFMSEANSLMEKVEVSPLLLRRFICIFSLLF